MYWIAAVLLPRLVRVSSEVKKEPAARPCDRRTMGTNRRLWNPVVTVKCSALTAVPPGVTTLIGPLVAPGGTMTSILVPDTISNSGALTPLNSIEVASKRWVPARVT